MLDKSTDYDCLLIANLDIGFDFPGLESGDAGDCRSRQPCGTLQPADHHRRAVTDVGEVVPGGCRAQDAAGGAMRRRTHAGLLVMAVAVLGCSRKADPPPDGVLFISIDTLRRDHMSCYDYGRPTSPRMDELARAGMAPYQ